MQNYSATALLKGLRTEFLQGYVAEMSFVEAVAFIVQSQSNLESYEWLGQVPQMQQVLAQAIVSTPLSDKKYDVTNGTFASAISFKRSDIADNKSGSISMRIQQLAATAARYPRKMMADLLINGTTGTGYDATAFYADAHPALSKEGGTQDNLLAGTGVTTAQFKADFAAAKAAMLSFKDEAGQPFHGDGGDLKYICVVPPGLEVSAKEALGAAMVVSTSNVLVGAGDVVVEPRLTDVNDWHLLGVAPGRKPLIFQPREPITLETLEEGSSAAFFQEQFHYKARARYGAGYGFWQCAVKTVNT